MAAPVNLTSPSPCTTAGSCFPGVNRVIARVSWDGSVDTSSAPSAAAFDGLVKGACSIDGSGFFVVGNSSTVGLGFQPFGQASLIKQFTSAGVSPYTACAVGSTTGNLYLLRQMSSLLIYIDTVPAAQAVPGAAAVAITQSTTTVSGSPYTAKQVIANAAETRFFVAIASAYSVADGGVFAGAATSGLTPMVAAATYKASIPDIAPRPTALPRPATHPSPEPASTMTCAP